MYFRGKEGESTPEPVTLREENLENYGTKNQLN